MSTSSKALAFSIVDWLNSKDVAGANEEKCSEAAALISQAFEVDTANATERAALAPGSPGLSAIFDVYLKAQKKVGAHTKSGASASAADADATASTDAGAPSAEDAAKADQLKNEGNKFMSAKDYGAALDAYTKAIALNATSPVFYSNRAAAYSQIGQHDEAIADATKASELNPKFGKAYSRLGHALFASGQYEEAIKAYEKGCEVDPSNALMKSGLDASKAKLAGDDRDALATQDARPSGGAGAGGMPGMGAGGMPDLSSLMNNPMMGQMAQQMMQNGGLEQLMNNPMLRQMADQFGSGGEMPDLSSMMNNPQLRQMAQQFMGNMGGQGGAGGRP
ncbi:hypothetical protein MVES_003691 [Malassezia vespertilionis]|uniref:Uncharacterized protein n=1 Tax=Malassezia vespertilionis TaxID=2020962 RepID=A0A2N1J7E8_9BASI|nr:hypothetical protein MVES_003691 [Malassezia vespertilionis]